MGGDSLYSPTRGGMPWQNPMDAIAGTAADTVGVIGKFVRDWLALDQLDDAFAEFADAFADINWADPQAIRDAIAAAGKLIWAIGQWIAQVIANFTQLDLTENAQFVRDLLELLAFDVLQEAWLDFSDGWHALNWANPATAMHPAWMLAVDFGWAIAAWVGQLIRNIFGITSPGWLALDDLKDLWQAFNTAWAGINWVSLTGIWNALRAVGGLIRGLTHWAIRVLRNLTSIDLEGIAASFGVDALAAALTTWADTLAGIDWSNPVAGLMTAIGAFFTLAKDLGNWLLTLIESWLGWNVSVVHSMFSSVGAFVERIIEYLFGAEGLAGWLHTLESLAGEAGATIVAAITAVYQGVQRLMRMFGQFDGFADFVTFLTDMFSTDGPFGWLVANLGKLSQPPPALDVSPDKIRQAIEQFFGGGLSVSQINNSTPNLWAQGNFNNETTIIPGNGFSWDWAVNDTGTGGSLKCVTDGTVQRFYSRQGIVVANGDRLNFSQRVRTLNFTPAGGRYIELAIIPWKLVGGVMTAQTPVVISTRTAASHGGFSDMTGSTYTVANDICRITGRITVVGHAGATVWVDNAYATKVGGLDQGNVTDLNLAWGQSVFEILGGSPVGKVWSDFVGAISALNYTADSAYGNADDALGIAGGAASTAGDAKTLAENTNTLAYNEWNGSGGSGSASNMQSVIASIKSSVVGGYQVDVISSNGSWNKANAPVYNREITEFWVICIGGGDGGQKGFASGGGSNGGNGGQPGKWMAKQISPSSIPSGNITCTIGVGGSGGSGSGGAAGGVGGTTSFGGLCSSDEALTASIGSIVGFYAATDSRPGVGGKGGNESGGPKVGNAGGSTPSAWGGSAGGLAGAGGAGGAADLSSATRTRAGGGGGGGGGAGYIDPGGAGGEGGVPGGGGGGGGASWSGVPTNGGNGGKGGNGRIVLVYKFKT